MDARNGSPQAVPQSLLQARTIPGAAWQFALRNFGGDTRADDARDVLHPGASAAFLIPAMQKSDCKALRGGDDTKFRLLFGP